MYNAEYSYIVVNKSFFCSVVHFYLFKNVQQWKIIQHQKELKKKSYNSLTIKVL